MMRPAVSLARLRFTPGSHEVVYARKAGHDESEPAVLSCSSSATAVPGATARRAGRLLDWIR